MSAFCRAASWAAVVTLSMSIAACGGGGGGAASAPTPPPVSLPAPAPTPAPGSTPSLQFGGFASRDVSPVLSDTTRVLAVTALAYDHAHDQLVTTVADDAGATLQGLDPITLATRWTLAAPGLASRIVVSDDGSTAYVAFPWLGAVWQVDLVNRAAVRAIQVGDASQHEGPLSLAARPGHPGTVAVSVGRVDLSTQHFLRTSVYDDGVTRQKSTGADSEYLVPDTLAEIVFTDADHVVGYDTQSTACALTRMALQPDGLQPVFSARPFGIHADCFGDTLAFTAGRLMTGQGQEVTADTFTYLRAWPSVGTVGSGFLDPFTGTWVRISGGDYTGQDTLPIDGRVYPSLRVSIEEIEPQRLTLRRSVLTQEPFVLQGQLMTEGLATSGSHIAFTVFDATTGNIALHSADLSSIPSLGHASFPVSTVSSTGFTGMSLQMPSMAIASDPARHRLVVALDASIGPDGNSLAVVNPDTGAVESLIPLLDRPADVKVSSTGSIAYVSHINAIPTFDRVDLVSGQVTTLPLRADAFEIKEDDPQSVVVFDYYKNNSLTALRDMSVLGSPVALRALTSVAGVNLVASNGPDQLLAFAPDITGLQSTRFSWTRDGIAYVGTGLLGATPGGSLDDSSFGMIWTPADVTDMTTGHQVALPSPEFTISVSPISATSAVLFNNDYSNSKSFSWIEAAPQGNWVNTFTLPVSDTAWTDPGGVVLVNPRILALNANQAALRISWLGEQRTSAQSSHIYIVKRTP